jgi:conjugal transfer pilus assembly protein TraF
MKKITIATTLFLFTQAYSLTGYFGYEDPLIKNDNNKTIEKNNNIELEKEKLLQKALHNPKALTATQFKNIQSYAKDKAVMQQTEKSIKDWMILNNFTIKAADSFQKKQRIVLFKNPELYEEGDLAKSGYAQKSNTQAAAKKQINLIKGLISKIALFAFFGNEPENARSSQERVLWYIHQDFPKMTIINVDIRQNKGLYEKLGEKVTPALWMAYKDNNDKAHWYRVLGGIATKNVVFDNIEFIYENIIKVEIEK